MFGKYRKLQKDYEELREEHAELVKYLDGFDEMRLALVRAGSVNVMELVEKLEGMKARLERAHHMNNASLTGEAIDVIRNYSAILRLASGVEPVADPDQMKLGDV